MLAQEGTSSSRHQDSQLQGTLQMGSNKQSEKQPKSVGPWTRVVLTRGTCQLQCKETWELRLRAQPERTTCSVGTQRKCVLESKTGVLLGKDKVGHQSISAYGWKKRGCTVLQQEPRAGLTDLKPRWSHCLGNHAHEDSWNPSGKSWLAV